MKVGRLDTWRGLAAGVLLGVMIFVILVEYAPDSVPFSPNNYGWNGLQEVASTYKVNFATSLSGVSPNAVLAVLQPSITYGAAAAKSVRDFLVAGGTVLVADKSGVANSLLEGIGSSIEVENQFTISDPVYNWRAKSVPTALILPGAAANVSFVAGVSGLALNQPAPLALGPGAVQVAVTSQFSETQTGSGGPFVVVAAEKMGLGTLIVIGDSQFLLNSEWTAADNRAMIGNLFANSSVFIDASHWSASPLTSSTAQVKAQLGRLYGAISAVPLRYVFVLAVACVAVVLVPTGSPRREDDDGRLLPRRIRGRKEGG